MSDGLLLFVFATHLPFFVWRYRRTGQLRFAATSTTFALLCLTYGLRVFAPELSLFGRPAHLLVRPVAWGCATWSLALLARHWLRRGLAARR